MGGQPMFILDEDAERTSGEDAQSSNITAGKAVSQSVRTTLGPRGMDKMLVSDGGDVVITNDGATILDEMDIEHPAAQMIAEVAETQENEVGDGTTTAAVLAGELLSKAEDLLDDDVHPTTIVEGYHAASELAHEAIDECNVDEELDDDLLETVARSSMTGKGTGDVAAEDLAETVVAAVRQVTADDGTVNRDNVSVYTQTGSSSSATRLVDGVIVDEELVHDNMPLHAADVSVAFIDDDIEIRESEVDAEYDISTVDDVNAALEAEEEELRGYAEHILDVGADAVFVDGDVDEQVAGILAQNDVQAFEAKSADGDALADATGLTSVSGVNELEAEDLGHADEISVEKFGDDYVTFVEDEDSGAVTVFARGGTEHVTDELERVLGDALDVVAAALSQGGVVPGAGATEIAVADHIRAEAAGVEGRKQLAVEAFADAVDVLPRTLAENTGMDPIDALVDLRAEHESEGVAGIISKGQTGEIGDPVEQAVLDPIAVKHEAISSASEAATMIVRIDDVISAS